ncbi:MAG: ABC transporter permease [Oscillospiraceae bacterium]|nr:ABC transporter permease [Oscillospiraceae bacterium]
MKTKSTRLFGLLRGFTALLVALLVAFILVFITSDEPFKALENLLITPLTNWNRISTVLTRMIPIVFTGLAVCVMFSADQFNLAGEGCVFAGGFAAGLCAVYLDLPAGIHTVVCLLAAMLVGAIIMLVPALLKAKLGASEMVVSLMMNYVILDVCLHFLHTYFKDRSQGATMTLPFQSTSILGTMFQGTRTSWGLLIAIVASVLVWLFMFRTKWGYAIRMVGINREFSKYSGIKVGFIIVLCQVVGGLISGLGGGVEQLGYYQTFRWIQLMGYGWDGVTLAILAGNNPLLVPVAAFFIAYLDYGCTLMNTNTSVPAEMMDIISVVIFLFFAAEQFLKRTRQRMVVKETERELAEVKAEEVSAE